MRKIRCAGLHADFKVLTFTSANSSFQHDLQTVPLTPRHIGRSPVVSNAARVCGGDGRHLRRVYLAQVLGSIALRGY